MSISNTVTRSRVVGRQLDRLMETKFQTLKGSMDQRKVSTRLRSNTQYHTSYDTSRRRLELFYSEEKSIVFIHKNKTLHLHRTDRFMDFM